MAVVLLEDDIDALDGGQHRRAVGPRIERAVRALVRLDDVVGVECDDKRSALFLRGLEEVDVAGMEQIECAVGEDDLPAKFLRPADQFVVRCDDVGQVYAPFSQLLVERTFRSTRDPA